MIEAIAESESSKGSPRYTITVLSESSKITLICLSSLAVIM